MLARFRELEPDAREGFAEETQLFPYLALTYGIGMLEWSVEWYAETERRLEAGQPLTERMASATSSE